MTPSELWCSPGLAQRRPEDLSWLVFDIETTGLDPCRHAIREYAAFSVIPSGRITEVSRWRAESDDASAFSNGLETMAALVRTGSVLVAHNIAFDLAFLAVRAETPTDVVRPEAWMCTLRMLTAPRRLDAFTAQLGVTIHDRHTAIGDGRALASALGVMLQQALGRGDPDVAAMVASASPGHTPSGKRAEVRSASGWASVRSKLDHVVPVPLPSARERHVFTCARRLLRNPDAGPDHPVEHEAFVAALRGAAMTATTFDLCVTEQIP